MELKSVNSPIWKSALITSIISALVGVLMIFNPFRTSVVVFKIIGAAILVYAIMDIVSTIQLKRSTSTFYNNKEETEIKNQITTENETVEADIEEIKSEPETKKNSKPKKRKPKKSKESE